MEALTKGEEAASEAVGTADGHPSKEKAQKGYIIISGEGVRVVFKRKTVWVTRSPDSVKAAGWGRKPLHPSIVRRRLGGPAFDSFMQWPVTWWHLPNKKPQPPLHARYDYWGRKETTLEIAQVKFDQFGWPVGEQTRRIPFWVESCSFRWKAEADFDSENDEAQFFPCESNAWLGNLVFNGTDRRLRSAGSSYPTILLGWKVYRAIWALILPAEWLRALEGLRPTWRSPLLGFVRQIHDSLPQSGTRRERSIVYVAQYLRLYGGLIVALLSAGERHTTSLAEGILAGTNPLRNWYSKALLRLASKRLRHFKAMWLGRIWFQLIRYEGSNGLVANLTEMWPRGRKEADLFAKVLLGLIDDRATIEITVLRWIARYATALVLSGHASNSDRRRHLLDFFQQFPSLTAAGARVVFRKIAEWDEGHRIAALNFQLGIRTARPGEQISWRDAPWHHYPAGWVDGAWVIRRLDTAQEIHDEGASQAHCVGGYFASVQKGLAAIYAAYHRPTRHRCTVELTLAPDFGLTVRQARGAANEALPSSLDASLRACVADCRFTTACPPSLKALHGEAISLVPLDPCASDPKKDPLDAACRKALEEHGLPDFCAQPPRPILYLVDAETYARNPKGVAALQPLNVPARRSWKAWLNQVARIELDAGRILIAVRSRWVKTSDGARAVAIVERKPQETHSVLIRHPEFPGDIAFVSRCFWMRTRRAAARAGRRRAT